MKLNRAMKKLNSFLFGERRVTIQLRSLIVRKTIVRLLLGVQIKVRELQLTADPDLVYTAFQHVIDETSHPLNSMVLSSGQATDYEHSIVQSGKKLIIRPNFSGLRTYLPIFMHLQNKLTIVEIKKLPFPVEDQILLIENWIEVDKEIGTYLAYGVSEERTVKELFPQIEQQGLGNRVSEISVEIPMNIGKVLKISYSRNEVEENLGGRENFTKPDWWVKMSVVAAEYR